MGQILIFQGIVQTVGLKCVIILLQGGRAHRNMMARILLSETEFSGIGEFNVIVHHMEVTMRSITHYSLKIISLNYKFLESETSQ